MPLALALILGLGSFGGYVGIQSGAADQALVYEQKDVQHHNIPWTFPTVVQYEKSPVRHHNTPWTFPKGGK
jgi:hypothetical protein